MAEEFANESCGPRPLQDDFLKKNGKVKWKAYNKANTRWLKCARTSIRQSEANVAARSEAAAAIGQSAAELGGDIANAFASQGEGVDFTDKAAPADTGLGTYLPYIAAAGALYLLLG